jgi:hypothetical protein
MSVNNANFRNTRRAGEANPATHNHALIHANTEKLNDITVQNATLNDRIGVDTSDSPLSLTALTRVQKDVIDNKLGQIAGFLDKDNSQFHLKHHTTSNLVGNTSADGSGTHNHAHVDGSGILKVSQVSSQNVQPTNLSNADHASHSQSFACGMRGRTNITDETTGKFLLCSTDGELAVDVVNQPNVKVEDLSSSLNAQHASGTSRSLAVGLKGTTNISDVPNNSVFLLCDAAGKLQIEQPLVNEVIDAALSVPNATPTNTTEYQIKSKPYKGKIAIVFESSIAGSALTLTPSFATSSGGTFYGFDLSHTEFYSTGNAQILIIKDFVPAFVRVSVSQSSGGTVSVKATATY